ncbi:MAG: arginine--tRNA ligase [Candidatus Gottesmanbacteria bacterium]|nr:arginine--tRNA ligase [Candidatus Gottesmanbacteria bacterium]
MKNQREAKDLALAPLKYSEWPYDRSIIMTGNEQSEYFKVMLAALAEINPDLASRTRHMPFGMVRLTTGKMSSRTGDVITADWLIEQAKKSIYKILDKNGSSRYSPTEKDDIAQKAAIAAIKYSMLRVNAISDIAFDIEASVSFEGDSGPYLQYTYARCKSVLRKASSRSKEIQSLALNLEERNLARSIMQFPDVVAEAATNFSPNTICTYLFHLAQEFNLFYAKHQILPSDSPNSPSTHSSLTRLALTAATAQVIKNGLYLLGIETMEQM